MPQKVRSTLGDTTLERHKTCDDCAIRHSSLCGAMSNDELSQLNAIATRQMLAPGQSFLFQGDVPHSFANVTQGVAKLVRGAADGRSQIVGLLFPSDFLDASTNGLNHQTTRYGIEAVTALELCVFPRKKFEAVVTRFPTLELKLAQRALTELEIAREWMVLLGRKTAQERVATFLLHVASKMKNVSCAGQTQFELPLNRADIGDYLGLTLETVSRQLSALRKANIIAMQGTREVRFFDEDKLRERACF